MEFNGTFIVTIITFIIFIVVMNKILYAPILRIMEDRKNFIEDNYNEAQHNTSQSEEILKEKDEKIGKVKSEAKEKFSKETSLAKDKKDSCVNNAKNQAKEELNNKRQDFLNAKEQTSQNLKGDIVNLAQLISDKFLKAKEEIKDVDDELINRIMQR